MGKLDDLTRALGGNVAESMGAGRNAGLAPGTAASSGIPERMKGVNRTKNAVEIPTEKIERDPDQPREVFEDGALARLAESLKTRGQLQAIRVRWDEERGVYVVIAGERRWRAAKMANIATISAVIVEGEMSAPELLALQLVENCLREDLRPVEQARAYRTLIEQHGWSIRHLASELALDHTAVSRALSLLELPESVQAEVEQGRIPTWTAYEIAKADGTDAQTELAARVVSEGLSRAETVEAVQQRKPRPKGRGARKTRKVTSRSMRASTGAKVTIQRSKGLDDDLIRATLAELLAQVSAKAGAGIDRLLDSSRVA
jgi:ParB family chromosome partitioning protein